MSAVATAHDINVKPRTGDVKIEENLDFRGLLLSEPIQQGLEKGGFKRPSPIQLKAIPLGRCGLDLIVQAKSGTGKTCVFSVIALEGLILDSSATQVLVLAPTREIAVQICEVINSIGSCMTGLRCLTFIGGTPLSEDRQKLALCHIAVGTPGRLKQLIEENILPTSNIRLFVLDEADKLLEDNFQEQINWIFSSLPDNKQMLALSATYPEVLAQHLTAYMRNPTFLRLNVTDPALLGIRQYYKQVEFHPLANKLFDRKTDALLELLSTVEFHQCLVFSNFQMRAESLSEVLNFRGWPATYISGSREQQDRMAAMTSLKQMTCRVLISTDLTSRGIDAENVNLVINLDLPPNHETYLHRIGRAGRFGTYGAGVSFVADGKEMEELKRLEKACNTTVKALPDPIPADLARSSGFVSLEHLVTAEKIVTQKDGVEIKSSKVPAPEAVKKDTKLSDADTAVKTIIKSSENGQHHPNLDQENAKKCNGNNNNGQSKPEAQQINGTGKNGDVSEKNGGKSEAPTASTGQRVPADEAVPTKPKWKTNNVWTNLSFSYGAECKQMEDQRKKGKLTHAGPADQRRSTSQRKDAAQSPRKDVANVAVEISVKKDAEKPVKKKEGGGTVPVSRRNKEPTLSIPSLKDIRGSPCQLRPFSNIMEDFANFTVKGESLPDTKEEDKNESSECFSLSQQYLENVSKLLKELSAKEETITAALRLDGANAEVQTTHQVQSGEHMKVQNAKIGNEKEESTTAAAQQDGANSEVHNCQQVQSANPSTPTTHQEESAKVQKEKHVKVESVKTANVQSEPTVSSSKVEPNSESRPLCQTDSVPCEEKLCKKSDVEKGSEVKSASEKVSPKKPDNSGGARSKETTEKSWSRGGTNRSKKSQVTLTVGSTLQQMLTNYATLNDSNNDKGAGINDETATDTSQTADNINKSKPYKPKKRVDPYGAWEPYVPPEPYVPVEESTEITDDEESEGSSESDWESSVLSYGEEEEDHGAAAGRDRQRSSAKPTQMGYEQYTPPPYYGTPEDYLAYQNACMAQQAVFYTSALYQQYMMHLQYAEYYRQQLKAQQHAQWDMGSLYNTHKKYIRKMAKWMAKHNPDE